MIKLDRPSEEDVLKNATRAYLERRQEQANGYAKRSADIRRAWSAFLRTNAKDDVARQLDAYHHFKCAYCEQVAAKDIEHFYPKSHYPRKMFRWTNFVRGCKNCNNAKLDKFPRQGNRRSLIDPCEDEPLDYLHFDFTTGIIGVNPEPEKSIRGETTCDMFDLNQEPLREERRLKFDAVVYLLAQVVRETPVTDNTQTRLQNELLASRPWLGILRQLFKSQGQYAALVSAAKIKLPQIEQWTGGWL